MLVECVYVSGGTAFATLFSVAATIPDTRFRTSALIPAARVVLPIPTARAVLPLLAGKVVVRFTVCGLACGVDVRFPALLTGKVGVPAVALPGFRGRVIARSWGVLPGLTAPPCRSVAQPMKAVTGGAVGEQRLQGSPCPCGAGVPVGDGLFRVTKRDPPIACPLPAERFPGEELVEQVIGEIGESASHEVAKPGLDGGGVAAQLFDDRERARIRPGLLETLPCCQEPGQRAQGPGGEAGAVRGALEAQQRLQIPGVAVVRRFAAFHQYAGNQFTAAFKQSLRYAGEQRLDSGPSARAVERQHFPGEFQGGSGVAGAGKARAPGCRYRTKAGLHERPGGFEVRDPGSAAGLEPDEAAVLYVRRPFSGGNQYALFRPFEPLGGGLGPVACCPPLPLGFECLDDLGLDPGPQGFVVDRPFD